MSGPRNKRAYDAGQSARLEIRALLKRHPTTAPALTAKAIQPVLNRRLSLRAIQWHIRAIRKPPRPLPSNHRQLAARARYLAQLGTQACDIAQVLGVAADQVSEWIEA